MPESHPESPNDFIECTAQENMRGASGLASIAKDAKVRAARERRQQAALGASGPQNQDLMVTRTV